MSNKIFEGGVANNNHRTYLYYTSKPAYYSLIKHDLPLVADQHISEIYTETPEFYRRSVVKWLMKHHISWDTLTMGMNPFGDTFNNLAGNVPNTYIIGAPRAMTTALAINLHKHKDACVAIPKEPKFFSSEYSFGLDYLMYNHYRHYNGEKAVINASVMDCLLDHSLDRIKETSGPDAKIIFGIRDPIERAVSNWSHLVSRHPIGTHPASIIDAFERNTKSFDPDKIWYEGDYNANLNAYNSTYDNNYLEYGLYYTMYKKIQSRFDNIFVYTFENLKDRYSELLDFIGIEQVGWYDKHINVNKNHVDGRADELRKYLWSRHPDIMSRLVMESEQMTDIIGVDVIRDWNI